MASPVVEAAFGKIVEDAAGKVKPLGFRHDDAVLRKLTQGNSAIVQFQRSGSSSAEVIRFTINLAVICGALPEPGQPALRRATSIHGHLRERIGMLLPSAQDAWWEVTESANVAELSERISGMVFDVGVPYVERYLDTNALMSLWRSGKSPGLTERQRLDYLARLGTNG
jgi:hypothetical protein